MFASFGNSCGTYDFLNLNLNVVLTTSAFSILFINQLCFRNCDDKGLQTNDNMVILSALSIVLAWLPFFYWICNFGENLTTRFAVMNDKIYDMSWHLYPPKLQKYVVLIIMMAQKPVYARGFAWVTCSRETFKSVIRYISPIFRNTKTRFSLILFTDYQHGLFLFHDASPSILG